MLQPKQQAIRREAVEVEKRFLELKAAGGKLGIPINVQAVCRIIAKEHSCSAGKIRMILHDKKLIKKMPYAKRASKKDSTVGEVQTGDGSEVDGDREMHAV